MRAQSFQILPVFGEATNGEGDRRREAAVVEGYGGRAIVLV